MTYQSTTQTPLIAAIDVGTNSFHVVIASVNNKGVLRVHSRAKEMVRLGSGGGDMKFLDEKAIDRGIAALKRFAAMAEKVGAPIRAIATSAVREADNKEDFIERAVTETGIEIEVVSGIEEARLIYMGALHAVPILTKRALVFDIGGGSTEMVIGQRGEAVSSHSAKLGAIRLTQRFFPGGVVTDEQLRNCREYIKGDLAPTFQQLLEHGFESVTATSGTAHTLGAMILTARGQRVPDVINGAVFTREELLQTIESIIRATTPRERAELPGIDTGRADIIVAGALIVEQIIIWLNIQKLTLSAFAMREGIVFDTIQKQKDIREFHHLSHLRYETVYNLCELYRVNITHAEHVRNLALQIFDDLQPMHLLGDKERELLDAAALLHDVGYHISPEQHHKHSYYMILNCVMPGFTNDEAELIANVARYHRKSHPKRKHLNFIALSPAKQRILGLLAGILRIAEGLDRRQQQLVSSVRSVTESGAIRIILAQSSSAPPDIELWGALRRKALLEEMLGQKINILVGNAAR